MSSEGLYKLNEIALINPKRKVLKGNEFHLLKWQHYLDLQTDIQKRCRNKGHKIAVCILRMAIRFKELLFRKWEKAQVNCLSDGEIGEGSTEFIVLCGISSKITTLFII